MTARTGSVMIAPYSPCWIVMVAPGPPRAKLCSLCPDESQAEVVGRLVDPWQYWDDMTDDATQDFSGSTHTSQHTAAGIRASTK
jgi:hypothetical protein